MPPGPVGPPRLCPYVGLSFYTEAEAGIFFGRDADRQIIMGNLRSSRLTLLYAESGVGKSSLLRAGVASRLGDLARRNWSRAAAAIQVPVVFSNWRDEPVRDLIVEIERAVNSFMAAGSTVELPHESLSAAISSALAALDAATAPPDGSERPGASLLIILDQFEEYFQNGSRAQRERLADDLAECLAASEPPAASSPSPSASHPPATALRANFLISIRRDAYSALGDLLTSRVSNVYGNYINLRYLDRARAREAIVNPIEWHNRHCGADQQFEIEDGLVEAVLAQVRKDPDGNGLGRPPAGRVSGGLPDDVEVVTPYLQLVMTTLWETEVRENSRTLRLATLARLPAREIVSRSLKDALAKLDPQAREVAIDALRYLVTPSGTKIALEVRDLAAPAYTGHPAEILIDVLGTLAGEARILREVGAPPGRENDQTSRRFEIYTDVLAQPINAAVNDRDTRRAQEHAERDRERARDAEDQARRDRNNARRSRLIAIAAGALALLALLLVVVIIIKREVSLKRVAQSNQIAAVAQNVSPSNPELGTLLALSALRLASTPSAAQLLRDVLPQLQEQRTLDVGAPATTAAFSRDGTLVATGSSGGSARVWIAATGAPGFEVATRQRDGVVAVDFSRDGRWLLVAGAAGDVKIVDVATGRDALQPWQAQPGLITAQFNPENARQLLTAGDGVTRVWSLAGNRARRLGNDLRRRDRGQILGAVYQPNGQQIATIGRATSGPTSADGSVDFWAADARSSKPIGSSLSVRGYPRGIAFSADGREIVTSSDDGTARVFDVASHAQPGSFPAGAGVLAAGFSSDRISLVVAARNARAEILDRAIMSTRLVLPGHDKQINAVSFSPDGTRIVTASADGTAKLWSATPVEQQGADIVQIPRPPHLHLQAASFNAAGGLIATANTDGVVALWNARNPQHPLVGELPTTEPAQKVAASAAFNKEGTLLVTTETSGPVGHYAGRTAIWDLRDTRHPRKTSADRGIGYLYGAQFSRDGTRILTAGASGVLVWNLGTGKLDTLAAGAVLRGANFSADGSLIATAGNDGIARIWDVHDLRHPRYQLGDSGGAAFSDASFSPDGTLLVTASDDGTATVWNLQSQTKIAAFAEPGGNALFSAKFSPNGKTVLTASKDGFARIWNLGTGVLLTSFNAGYSIEDAEFNTSGTEAVTAGDDGVARVFSTELSAPLARLEQIARERVDRGLTPAEKHLYASTSGG